MQDPVDRFSVLINDFILEDGYDDSLEEIEELYTQLGGTQLGELRRLLMEVFNLKGKIYHRYITLPLLRRFTELLEELNRMLIRELGSRVDILP